MRVAQPTKFGVILADSPSPYDSSGNKKAVPRTYRHHERTQGLTNTWITPRYITQALGEFDLDPCAATDMPWYHAATNWTEEDDGLSKEWFGRVWLNPPYGRYTATWMKRLAEYGKYEIMPAHTPKAYAELKASIADHGLQQALVYDEDGHLLDGFARERICGELGIPCDKKEIRRFGSEAEKLAFILSVNMPRRQFGTKEKESLIRDYLLRDVAICDNTLAKLIGGISKNTVADVRAKMEAACLIDKVEQRRGADGKMYPATYPSIVVNSEKELAKALKAIKDLPLNGKTMDVTSASRRARRNKNKKARQGEVITPLPNDAIKLYHCPFQDLETVAAIAPASVNLVCTDIPYGKDFLPQIGELAAMAKRILVEGGLFVTHSGHYYLDQVMQALGEHLTYRWEMASIWNGDANMVHPLDLGSQWKPILIYSKGPWVRRYRWYDVSRGLQGERMP